MIWTVYPVHFQILDLEDDKEFKLKVYSYHGIGLLYGKMGVEMFSLKEKEIIERCLSISIWNYRAGKSKIDGRLMEVGAFQEKTRRELQILNKLILDQQCPTVAPGEKFKTELEIARKEDGVFKKIFGRMLRGVKPW